MLFALFVSIAMASDQWICTSESSVIEGSQIKSCGVGHGASEDIARAKAFDSAEAEFKHLCGLSDECTGHAVSVAPRRTTCDESGGKWKCYRMLVFTIGDKKEKTPTVVASQPKPRSRPQPKPLIDEDGYEFGDLRYGMGEMERLVRNMGKQEFNY